VWPVEQNEIVLPAEGSIADILRRLEIWCQRADKGFSRVQYFSEFSRMQLVDRLRNQLQKDNIDIHEIHLPTEESPSDFTRILLDKLGVISSGVVSITGFPNPIVSKYPMEDYLRALNFNRENLAKDAIRQIWWVSTNYIDNLVRTAPDLDSWFVLRLHLTENVAPSYEMQAMLQPIDKPTTNIDEARKRSGYLKERFVNALKQDALSSEILEQIVLPAVQSLQEAGADIEAKELSSWMLEQLSESDLQKPDDPNLSGNLSNLAKIYFDQGDYQKAEILLKKSLEITEKLYESDHVKVAARLNNLALLYKSQGKYEQAEPLYFRAIEIHKKALGYESPDLANGLNNLAELYRIQSKYEQAEPLLLRAVKIGEKTFKHEHPKFAGLLNNLAGLYNDQGKYNDAQALYLRAIEIAEKVLPDNHPNLAISYENYADLLQKTGREDEAREYESKAQTIHSKRISK
jgi:tetratricopeptide (TPR) repeat protein